MATSKNPKSDIRKPKQGIQLPEGLLEQAKGDIKSSWDYVQDTYTQVWDNAWKLYNNESVDSKYKGLSKAFDPMSFTMVETNIANVFGNKPRVAYLPTQLEQQTETKVLNQMFNYTWDKNNLSYHILPFGRSLYVTGNACIWSTWDSKTDWIKAETIAVRDCIFDPTARNPWEMRYGGYRKLVMKEDLATVKMNVNGEWVDKYQNLDTIPTWSNGDNAEMDKQIKDCYTGSFLDGNAKRGQVELIVMYYVAGKYKGKVVEIANRNIVVFAGDSAFQKPEEKRIVSAAQYDDDGQPKTEPDQLPNGQPNPKAGKPILKKQSVLDTEIEPFIPVAFQRNTTDESLLYGKGEIEPMADLQEQLNDTINLKRDNFTHNINNQWTIDPKFKDQIPKIKNIPNTVYALPAGALVPLQKEDMTASADIEIQRIKQSIRDTTAMDEVVQGSQARANTTATQINQQMNQAGQRFSIKLQALENESFAQLGDQWFKLFRIFVTDKQVIRVAGRRGIDWLKLDPELYWGHYEPKVTLEQNAKAMAQDEIKRIEGAANILLNNPYVDQKEMTRIIAQKLFQYDDDEADTILVKDEDLAPQTPPQGAPGQMGPQGAMAGPPQASPFPTMPNGQLAANPAALGMPEAPDTQGPKTVVEKIMENVDYVDMPEDIKRQMEQQLGFTPSQMASPTQQAINAQGLQLHASQQANQVKAAQVLLDHHSKQSALDQKHAMEQAQLQHTMQQAQAGNDMQQQQMDQQAAQATPVAK